jgi:hypothetical protein
VKNVTENRQISLFGDREYREFHVLAESLNHCVKRNGIKIGILDKMMWDLHVHESEMMLKLI